MTAHGANASGVLLVRVALPRCSAFPHVVVRLVTFLLSRLRYPEFPEPIGVFRDVDRPTYDERINAQVEDAIAEKGEGDSGAFPPVD